MSQTENKVLEALSTEESNAVINQELVDRLTTELESFNKEIQTKVYPVKLESDFILAELITFIENEASWKNMEALGIIEVSKVLNSERLTGIKSGNIYLQSLPIQALSFFLSKVESKGIKAAEQHIKFIKPIDDALKLIKLDKDKLNSLQSEHAAAENGIEVAKPIEE